MAQWVEVLMAKMTRTRMWKDRTNFRELSSDTRASCSHKTNKYMQVFIN